MDAQLSVEILAAMLGVANVTLVAWRSIWNYPFAIAMVILYGGLFYVEKLYSDALLQIFFLVINIYGWVYWQRSREAAGEILARSLPARNRILWTLGGLVAIALWGGVMAHYTDAVLPHWDAGIAIGSVVAQVWLSRRYWENWVLWILVDIVSIGIYGYRGLYVTVALYALFLLLSIWGLVAWRQSMRTVAA